MGLLQSSVSIAANATNANVVQGSQYEFVESDSFLSVGVVASATGLQVDFVLTDNQLVSALLPATTNVFPVRPDNFPILNRPVMANDRLVLRVTNTTGGALTLFYTISTAEAPERV